MKSLDVEKWVAYLEQAERDATAVPRITEIEPGLTVDDSYTIQEASISRRVAAGDHVVGAKIGLTSRAKQEEMGVSEPIFGWLTDSMQVPSDSILPLDGLIHPRVEPEIVFVLGRDLAGPGVGVFDVLNATAVVYCGLEVIDSRFTDFKFLVPDVVADNASACRFAVGSRPVLPTEIDLPLIGCLFEENGALVATAAGAAILGHPALAVAQLANFLGRKERRLEAGWVVLAGALTSSRTLSDGARFVATFARLGRIGIGGKS